MRPELYARRHGGEIDGRLEIGDTLLEPRGLPAVSREVVWSEGARVTGLDQCSHHVGEDRNSGRGKYDRLTDVAQPVQDGVHSLGMICVRDVEASVLDTLSRARLLKSSQLRDFATHSAVGRAGRAINIRNEPTRDHELDRLTDGPVVTAELQLRELREQQSGKAHGKVFVRGQATISVTLVQ